MTSKPADFTLFLYVTRQSLHHTGLNWMRYIFWAKYALNTARFVMAPCKAQRERANFLPQFFVPVNEKKDPNFSVANC